MAIVTGASTGIGEAIATALASLGASVVLSGRDTACLTAVHKITTEAGGAATVYTGDVKHEKTHQELVQLAVDKYGGEGCTSPSTAPA